MAEQKPREHSPYLMHQFDDLEQQRLTYIIGMWVFLVTELLLFGGLFLGYTVYRFIYANAWSVGSHELSILAGSINTTVLLTSSLTMALAIRALQMNNHRLCATLLLATVALGLVFLGIKAWEYHHEWVHHRVPGFNFTYDSPESYHLSLYFSFYFTMTGLHALHMIIGVIVVSTVAVMVMRNRFSPERFEPVEMTGLYWHFIDIIWIFLFPLLYLVG